MISPFSCAAAFLLFASPPASGTDDAPIPYDEPQSLSSSPSKAQVADEASRRAGADENHIGIHVEGLAGILLQDSSRGAVFDPQFAFGARAGFEVAQLFSSNEDTRRSWLLEFLWARHSSKFGTALISTNSTLDVFSLAPAYAVNLDAQHFLQIVLQLGGGIVFQQANTSTDTQLPTQSISGIKPLLQAGTGLRWQLPLNSSQSLRLLFRADATYLRRGYFNDVMFSGSTGLVF